MAIGFFGGIGVYGKGLVIGFSGFSPMAIGVFGSTVFGDWGLWEGFGNRIFGVLGDWFKP